MYMDTALRIVTLAPFHITGHSAPATLAQPVPPTFWRDFMVRRHEVERRTADTIALRVYAPHPAPVFAPTRPFTQWVGVEVEAAASVPDGMQAYRMEGGLYAAFIHYGPAQDFPATLHRVIAELQVQGYEPDERDYFERLPEGYNPMALDAQEEAWIPIQPSAA
ncbi:MAG: hypothetical protein RhofKO_25420 [Rhodothermales bacterium]